MAEFKQQSFEGPEIDLMKWHSKNRSLEDILKALQTSRLVKVSPEELLSRLESKTWSEIWGDLGVAPER